MRSEFTDRLMLEECGGQDGDAELRAQRRGKVLHEQRIEAHLREARSAREFFNRQPHDARRALEHGLLEGDAGPVEGSCRQGRGARGESGGDAPRIAARHDDHRQVCSQRLAQHLQGTVAAQQFVAGLLGIAQFVLGCQAHAALGPDRPVDRHGAPWAALGAPLGERFEVAVGTRIVTLAKVPDHG